MMLSILNFRTIKFIYLEMPCVKSGYQLDFSMPDIIFMQKLSLGHLWGLNNVLIEVWAKTVTKSIYEAKSHLLFKDHC